MSNNYFNDSEEEHFLPKKGSKRSFDVPENYFDHLSNKIINKIELEEELKEFSKLSQIKKEIPYTVPKNYFESNENLLEYECELLLQPQLSKIPKVVLDNGNQQEYFEALSENIFKRIDVIDELKEYKLLHSIDKQNNFAVAPDYFETLADEIKEKVHRANHRQPSIIEQLIVYLLKPKIAFAYSMIFILAGATIWFKFQHEPEVLSGDCKTLACLEKNEMLNEHTIREFDEENLYDMVDVDKLDKQISSDSTVVNPSTIKKQANSVIKNKE